MNTSESILVRASGRVVALPLSDKSPWARLLGPWLLPAEGSLEAMERAFESHAPLESVTLVGCPSACLMPLLWLRSMWLSPTARVSLEWNHVEDPDDQPGRQAAGRLACLLAGDVRCADPARALQWWGWDGPSARWSDNALDAFDLLTNLVDLWDVGTSPSWSETVRRAIAACRSAGMKRVALYGAGTHTRAVGDALMEPGVEIVGIIDDDHRRHGQRLWGFPIISPDRALELEPDAIILSANTFEDQLWEKTATHRAAGIHVARLYTETATA